MRASPPKELVELLSRLELASPADVRAAYRHARRLAKHLPLFDSVWVDALVQARRLTPFQAAEINAGRGDSLRVGPYLLLARGPSPVYGSSYRARHAGTSREVRLTVVALPEDPQSALNALSEVVRKSSALATEYTVPIEQSGWDAGRLWIASPPISGRTAAEWLIYGGRMPPDVVLEIARQMAAALTVCEAAGLVHADMSAQQLVLDPLGIVRLLEPGLRAVMRPREDDSLPELPPEGYDYLAPERIVGALASIATDIYACGALWWHLLAGRPPLVGATAALRRKAAQSTRIRDIYPIAPDTPRVLVEAIRQCTEHAIERRPASFAAILSLLGPPSDRGQDRIARHLARGASPPERLVRRVRTIRRSPNMPTWAAAVGGAVLALGIGAWPIARGWMNRPGPAVAAAADVSSATQARPSGGTASTSVPPQVRPPSQASVSSPSVSALPQKPTAAAARPANRPEEIVRATALQPTPPRGELTSTSREFVISAARPVAWNQIRPQPGQTVRSRPGERAQIILPADGAELAGENIRFEDIDFSRPTAGDSSRPLIAITARSVSFLRCSFQAASASDASAAIGWVPIESGPSQARQPPCALEMQQCVIAQVGDGLSCRFHRQAMLSLVDVLFIGRGALVNVGSAERSAATIDVALKHCTVRGAHCALALEQNGNSRSGDRLQVEARECVLAIVPDGAVIMATAADSPGEARQGLSWQGAETLMPLQLPVVAFNDLNGKRHVLRETSPGTKGLVRTDFGFAGEPDEGPDASRLVRWRAVLRTSTPPGIRDIPFQLPPSK